MINIFELVENGIEYTAIECCGPLEYNDAKCVIFDSRDKNCIIFYNQNAMYGNTSSGGVATLHHKEYYKNRELHRISGPAIESFIDPSRSKYYLDGVSMNHEKYKIKLRKIKIKRLNSL